MARHGFFAPPIGCWETDEYPPEALRQRYPEGWAEIPLRPRPDHGWNGTEWIPTPPSPEPVPDASPLQLFDELDQTHGIDLETEIGGLSQKALRRFRLSNTIKRTDQFAAGLQAKLGWTDAQVDALFRAAAARE